MKNKMINAAICDARKVKEESLSGFENITINAAVVLTSGRSAELFNRYPVTINAAAVVEAPENISVKIVNGKHEIDRQADGKDTFLIVNGKLSIASESLEAAQSYYKILANGNVVLPRSYKGQLPNLTVNGKTVYYPDGAVILKANSEIDNFFLARASNPLYYCAGSMLFLDAAMDTDTILSKNLKFASDKIVIAESLAPKLISQFDEEAEIVRVQDGSILIDGNLDLKPATIRKYGTKLCVCGDVSIGDAEALSALEFLYVDGEIRIAKNLKDAFEKLDSIYDELKIIDPDVGHLNNRPMLKVGAATLKKFPKGVQIEDCAKVTLGKELSPDDIMEKIRISDCALVSCTLEQEEAVHMIANGVAKILVAGEDEDDSDDFFGTVKGFLGKLKDTQMINAAEYTM